MGSLVSEDEISIFMREDFHEGGIFYFEVDFKSGRFEVEFIHSGHFYSVLSSPLLLRGAPDTERIGLLCRNFTLNYLSSNNGSSHCLAVLLIPCESCTSAI